ncbi:MAG: Ig-like domain-containing protein [Paenibacillus sp.]|uniref:Ig-like domain-containing protein n=1 Tax=Paenibacillus sp. TaxID=58172 RepID=UPI002906842D|nr:Ig-like domain-containing protein [Paenibacillus sp.]MDU4698073.1 Ig-like domain-containing protein [Paenibacillus sp.]
MFALFAKRKVGFVKLFAALCIASLLPLYPLGTLPTVSAASLVTIDTPAHGDEVEVGTLTVSGQYTEAYNIVLIVNGTEQLPTQTVSEYGEASGVWVAEVDTSRYDGEITLLARGTQSTTRYGVSSPPIRIHVDNPQVTKPVVSIRSPLDGAELKGKSTPIHISVDSRNRIRSVEVRINGGAWQKAAKSGKLYKYNWNTKGLGNKTSSLEARATDEYGNIGRSMTLYASTGTGTHEPITLERQDRAMWIWEKAAYNLFLNPGSRAALQAFADDTATFGSDPITTFYIGVFPYGGVDILEEAPDKVRDFVSWAHVNGYQVHACIAGGTTPPYMGALAPYHEYAVREIEKVINYNIAAAPNERFDGVNVDIEPYILPEFNAEKPSVQLQYLDVLQKMIDRRNTAGIDLPFGPAIPRWFDSSDGAKEITWNGQTKWLSEHVQDLSDYISIMDYRDVADGGVGIIAQAQGELSYANAIGKPNSVVVGVETLDIASSGDPETITFREEGRMYMEAELDKVYASFQGDPAFAGIAMHHYDSIRWLPSTWGPDGHLWRVDPADTEPPSALPGPPLASTAGFQSVELSYGRATDNSDIEHYLIYRGTEPEFPPDEAHVAGSSRNLTYTDTGLLPNTTYYYKVAAMDISGNIGPATSSAASATTATSSTYVRPLIVSEMNVTFNGTRAEVRLEIIDLETGQGVPAAVYGRFTQSGGRYIEMVTNADGLASGSSEALSFPSGEVGFLPQRIVAPGYYWASAYDIRRHITAVWPQR